MLLIKDLRLHIDVTNEELGQRRVDTDDELLKTKLRRFSLSRRKVSSSDQYHQQEQLPPTEMMESPTKAAMKREKEQRDLAAAFRVMAATRSPDKEGDNFGAAVTRDDASVSAMKTAKRIEAQVVDIIKEIGDVVVNGEYSQAKHSSSNSGETPPVSSPSSTKGKKSIQQTTPRSDPVFEYFCEKSILTLLVDIAKEKRFDQKKRVTASCFHGVVWSPLVKAQVFQTVSTLLSDVRNHSVLYYLLSQNQVNELINCMLPLNQWTDQALSRMMPAYLDLLRNAASLLSSDPQLFPFLTESLSPSPEQTPEVEKSKIPAFPLFSASLDAATSAYAHSDSAVYGACVDVAVSIMSIPHPPIQGWIGGSSSEQRRLSDHLCNRLLERYRSIANLTTGPVVDPIRSNALTGQLVALTDHLLLINDVFWSGIQGLDVRLSESMLRKVVSIMLNHLVSNGKFLEDVGVIDADVVPEREAFAQTSLMVLSHMFFNVDYVPLQRMLAVALFHPKSTLLWDPTYRQSQQQSPDAYTLVPALNEIVAGKASDDMTRANPFRQEIIKSLRGEHGDWRVIPTALLIENVLKSNAMETKILSQLGLISSVSGGDYTASPIEEAVATYMQDLSHPPSPVFNNALECMGSLSLQLIFQSSICVSDDEKDSPGLRHLMSRSPVWIGLQRTRQFFCKSALDSQSKTGVADIFLDLLDAAISNRYTAHINQDGTATYKCLMSLRGCSSMNSNADVLIRKFRGVTVNDVEYCRLYINMGLHFRSLCKIVDHLFSDAEISSSEPSSPKRSEKRLSLELTELADGLLSSVGGLRAKPSVGNELDLTGRMSFKFSSSFNDDNEGVSLNIPVGKGTVEDGKVETQDLNPFRPTTHLVLVLDPTDICVVKTSTLKLENRGTILSTIPLRSIIAAAADNDWLHVAVRHEDVENLIKNGNMAMKFDSPSTCLIVKQYLDRSREVLRQNLMTKITELFSETSAGGCDETAPHQDDEVPSTASSLTV